MKLSFFPFFFVTGVEITSISLLQNELIVSEGLEVMMPCTFTIDDHNTEYEIQLEWSVMPTDSDSFQPIIQFDNDKFLPTSYPTSKRASIDQMSVRKGDCTLVINHVKETDSGIYKVRMGINGYQTEGSVKKIHLYVRHKLHAIDQTHSKKTSSGQPMRKHTTNDQLDPDILELEERLQSMKDNGTLLYIGIGVVAFFSLMAVCSLISIICG